MLPILCIYPCWYDSTVTVKRQWAVMVASLAEAHEEDSMKWMWYRDERDKGCIGSFSHQIPQFFDKRRDKSVASKRECVCVPDREPKLWRDDECMILHTSERLSDRDRQTETEGEWMISGCVLWNRGLTLALVVAAQLWMWCVFVFVCVCFYLLTKPSPEMQASEASIGIRRSLPFYTLILGVFSSMCVLVGGVYVHLPLMKC